MAHVFIARHIRHCLQTRNLANQDQLGQIEQLYQQRIKPAFAGLNSGHVQPNIVGALKEFNAFIVKILGEEAFDTAQKAAIEMYYNMRTNAHNANAVRMSASPSPGLDMQVVLAARQAMHQNTVIQQSYLNPGSVNPSQQLQQQQASQETATASQGAAGGKPPKASQPKQKRPQVADGGDGTPAPKKPRATGGKKRAPAAGGGGGDKNEEGDEFAADSFLDMEEEANKLMSGFMNKRLEKQNYVSDVRPLNEWRIVRDGLVQVVKNGLPPDALTDECVKTVQMAFHGLASRVLERARRAAQHRQDTDYRQFTKEEDLSLFYDPRRGLGAIERRERGRAEEEAVKERERLFKMAGSKRANEETKEKAKAAKLEIQGQQQAKAANIAVNFTLGKGKETKWERWGVGGGSAAATAAAAPSIKEKSVVDADAETARVADTAVPATSSDAVAAAMAEDGDKQPGLGKKAAMAVKTSRSRATLNTGNEEPADTVLLKDILSVLERDPNYSKSSVIYCLLNGIPLRSDRG
jgi:hypothetical protein